MDASEDIHIRTNYYQVLYMKEVDNIAQLQNDIQELEKRYGHLQHAHAALEKRFEELRANKNLLVETILSTEAKEKNYRKIRE